MTERGHLSFNWFEVISVNHYCILWGLHPDLGGETSTECLFREPSTLFSEKWNEFLFYYQQSLCYHMEKECPVRPRIMALVYAKTGVTLIYIMGNCEARQSQNCFTTKRQLVGNLQTQESVNMADESKCCPVLRWLPDVWSVVWTLESHSLKGCPNWGIKAETLPELHRVWMRRCCP